MLAPATTSWDRLSPNPWTRLTAGWAHTTSQPTLWDSAKARECLPNPNCSGLFTFDSVENSGLVKQIVPVRE